MASAPTPTGGPSATTSTSTRSCCAAGASFNCSAGARRRTATSLAGSCSRASRGPSGQALGLLGAPRSVPALAVERRREDVLDALRRDELDRRPRLRGQVVEGGV